jgi:ATP-binding cassette subfamily B protein
MEEWKGVVLIAVVLMLIVTVVSQVQQLSRSMLNTYVTTKVVLRFRSELFRQVQRLSLAYHDSVGSSDTLYRIQYDATSIQNIVIEGGFPFIVSGVTLASMLYITLRIDRQLALVALTVIPMLMLIMHHYRHRLRQQSKEVRKLESSAMSVLQEALGAVRVVKAFGQEDREQNRFDSQSDEGLNAKLRLARAERSMGMWVGLVIAGGTAMVLYFGIIHVREQNLSLGNLLVVMGYLNGLYSPLKTMSSKVARLQSYLTSAERALAILDEAVEVPERPGALTLARAKGDVHFENVTFGYAAESKVLRDVELQIPAGSRVGIAGPTGAGKSTLMNLLMRFYDPSAGRILLDGVDLRDYKVVDLRNQYSIVLQDTVLFSTSIAENIAYALPEATRDQIAVAARAANAHEFIMAMPDGYDTLVGERGMRLSGGERQRISLARAFLKNAPILILDEPTSSVDVATESAIMTAIHRLMHGRTTFMITHRPGTLEGCDIIVRMKTGGVLEQSEASAALMANRINSPG